MKHKGCLLLFLILSFSCTGGGELDQQRANDPKGTEKLPNDLPKEQPNEEPEELKPAFELDKSSLKLLPFHIRMKKLEVVTGRPQSDPIFSELNRNRYSLGDHNYGSNIGPDLNWNATKMALWVKSIQPICSSDVMAELYDLPTDLDTLWVAAHSRSLSTQEKDRINAIDITNLDPAGQYETYCVMTLSSAEFVAQ